MKPRLLDLFCGAGGAAMGYHRAGFAPYGIDNKSQKNYPFPFLQMDALEAMDRLLRGEGLTFSNGETLCLEDFSAIHASPPCQGYVDRNCNRETKHPKLIEPVRDRFIRIGKPFVIENVYKAPLKATLMLCGTMFGLKVLRHRYFEFSFTGPMSPYTCNHNGTVANGDFIAIYIGGYHAPTLPDGTRPFSRENEKIDIWLEAMGIDWMKTKFEIKEAIPPAYTEYIGKYLLEVVRQ